MTPYTSFIIPHKGREAMLIDTLQSIAEQNVGIEEFEVIVISQNQAVSEKVKHFKNCLALSIIYNDPNNSISHSRNLGAESAKGEFLAFLDADIYLAPNWLSTMRDTLQSTPSVVLVSAMQQNSDYAPPLEKIRTALSNAELDTNVSFLPGRNLFLRKQTFYQAGKFPEHLLTCEDYYFTDKVNQLGSLYYTSKSSYVHIGEDKAFIPMWKKEVWRGQSNLASLKGRKVPLREYPSFLIPFVISGGWLGSLVALLLGQTSLASLLFLLALLPFTAYTLRLKKLTASSVALSYCLLFYLLYFPARALGTLLGVSGTVSTDSHKSP
ncbi:hypothetical protein D210916BOD24_08050 [Alteromonas sp. D210916BOD_24]